MRRRYKDPADLHEVIHSVEVVTPQVDRFRVIRLDLRVEGVFPTIRSDVRITIRYAAVAIEIEGDTRLIVFRGITSVVGEILGCSTWAGGFADCGVWLEEIAVSAFSALFITFPVTDNASLIAHNSTRMIQHAINVWWYTLTFPIHIDFGVVDACSTARICEEETGAVITEVVFAYIAIVRCAAAFAFRKTVGTDARFEKLVVVALDETHGSCWAVRAFTSPTRFTIIEVIKAGLSRLVKTQLIDKPFEEVH